LLINWHPSCITVLMFEVLFNHIQEKVVLTEQERDLIKTFFVPKRLRKRQYLLQEGDVCKHLSFVVKGLLRSYNVDEKGNEHMNLFAWEGWWISDMFGLFSGKAALFNIDAIESSELLMISPSDYEEMMLKVPVMERYFRILYQNSLVTKDLRLMSSVTHTAEEKYLQLAQSHPQILQRIPQNLVASYRSSPGDD
jgi:CRP-like cAMP-binding protein